MKKFVLKVLLFFTCVVVMDLVFGQLFSYLRAHAKGGSTANCEYIANQCQADIIILGSSRATHHYVPQIIEDALGLTCYNCGEEGNGVVLAYGRFKMLTNRYKPKLILYEMTPGYDYGTLEPNTKYLGYLRQYYKKDGIKDLFHDFDDELSSLKMLSQMYQNTAKLLPNLFDNIAFRDNQKGYSPLYGQMEDVNNANNNDDNTLDIDCIKLSYVERIIAEAQDLGVPIVFMISPKYGMHNNSIQYQPEIDICYGRGIPYYNYLNYEGISNRAIFFQDRGHLNDEGAKNYTMLILPIIRKYIN